MLRAAPPGHPLQKPTVVQWDIGAMLSADGAADESVSPQSGISPPQAAQDGPYPGCSTDEGPRFGDPPTALPCLLRSTARTLLGRRRAAPHCAPCLTPGPTSSAPRLT